MHSKKIIHRRSPSRLVGTNSSPHNPLKFMRIRAKNYLSQAIDSIHKSWCNTSSEFSADFFININRKQRNALKNTTTVRVFTILKKPRRTVDLRIKVIHL